MSLSSALFVFGLTLDILGAYYLAQSFITKNLEDLTFEGTSGYGSPPNLRYIKSNLLQKAEAQIGFSLLALGFILQSFDYFFFSSEQSHLLSSTSVLLCVVVLLLLTFLLAGFIKGKLFARYAKRMAAIVIRESKPEGERNDSWITKVAGYLLPDLRPAPNENDRSFVDRILSELNIRFK
jgi:hypothetical protein